VAYAFDDAMRIWLFDPHFKSHAHKRHWRGTVQHHLSL